MAQLTVRFWINIVRNAIVFGHKRIYFKRIFHRQHFLHLMQKQMAVVEQTKELRNKIRINYLYSFFQQIGYIFFVIIKDKNNIKNRPSNLRFFSFSLSFISLLYYFKQENTNISKQLVLRFFCDYQEQQFNEIGSFFLFCFFVCCFLGHI